MSWWSPFVLARVALLAEGVDRNMLGSPFFGPALPVALLAEGVDRNSRRPSGLMYASVALLAEGVDRNFLAHCLLEPVDSSPSSRRAWIEILDDGAQCSPSVVALLAEGVDRNVYGQALQVVNARSPSSRRAWIEIVPRPGECLAVGGRPPRGGRG